jgi:hypothetical protein
MKNTILFTMILITQNAFAINVDFYTTVAKEAFDSGDYPTAVKKCEAVLQQDSSNAVCGKIVVQAKAKINKQQKDHAEKVAQASAAIEAKHQAADQKNNSKECVAAKSKRDYCQLMQAVQISELQIEHENKVGAQTGYVNAALLRNVGSRKINLEEQAQVAQGKYQAAAGKPIQVSDCNLTVVPIQDVKIGTDIRSDVTKYCADNF